MAKEKRTYQKPLHIDVDFYEALERFGTTDPKELPENVRLRSKGKTGSTKPPVPKDRRPRVNRNRQSRDS